MFEHPINPFSNGSINDHRRKEQTVYAQQYNMAVSRFKSAFLKGNIFRVVTMLLRRKSSLYDLNEIRSKIALHGSHYAGIKVVRIKSIIGSESKTTDFDMGFHPMNEKARQRWVSMAMAYFTCLPLPPVQLIQIEGVYFVRDGHHRISVARALGQIVIDAEVITWNASAPFPWEPTQMNGSLNNWKRAKLSTAK